jgi:hypothetical protein
MLEMKNDSLVVWIQKFLFYTFVEDKTLLWAP